MTTKIQNGDFVKTSANRKIVGAPNGEVHVSSGGRATIIGKKYLVEVFESSTAIHENHHTSIDPKEAILKQRLLANGVIIPDGPFKYVFVKRYVFDSLSAYSRFISGISSNGHTQVK
jgi:hypothetical protein